MWTAKLHELIRSTVGTVTYDATPGSDVTWYRAQHRGAPVWYAIRDNRDEGANVVRVAASLGGRPICLWVHHRGSAIHLGAPPELATGDPQFDATCEVHGFPAEVIERVLDERTRHHLASRLPHEPTMTRQGCLRSRRQVPVGDPFRFDVPREAVVAWFDEVVDLASRLVAAFDAHHADLAQRHGAAAAQAWVDHARAQEQALATTRAARRGSFNRMLALVVVIPVIGVIVVTVVVLLSFL